MQEDFIDTVKRDKSAALAIISDIRSVESESSNPIDKKMLFEVIESTVGFSSFERVLFTLLRKWMISVTEKALSQVKYRQDEVDLVETLAYMNEDAGNEYSAEILLLHAVELRERIYGELHTDTLLALQELAYHYEKSGDLDSAKMFYCECLKKSRKALGNKHPDTITALHNLANVYESLKEYAIAERLYIEAYDSTCETLGETHPDCLTTLNNIATLYATQQLFADALPLFVQVLKQSCNVLGSDHRDTKDALRSLEHLYKRMRIELGDDNETTLQALSDLAEAYERLNLLEKATSLYQENRFWGHSQGHVSRTNHFKNHEDDPKEDERSEKGEMIDSKVGGSRASSPSASIGCNDDNPSVLTINSCSNVTAATDNRQGSVEIDPQTSSETLSKTARSSFCSSSSSVSQKHDDGAVVFKETRAESHSTGVEEFSTSFYDLAPPSPAKPQPPTFF
jgi:tetratricopeptide (TPR) repeat protein